MPFVSVIVPSFNHARYLGQAIECVLGQTFEDLELIVVDDRSDDDSVDVARAVRDPRLQVHLNHQNLGTYRTLNRCLDIAVGDWIAVLDSDDFWHLAKLERQLDVLGRYPEAAFSYTFGTTTFADGSAKHDSHHQGLPSEPLQQPIASLLIENRILASSLVFRRGAIRFDGRLSTSGDWVALLNLCSQGPAAFVDEPLTFWRHHPSNTSRDAIQAFPEEVMIRRAILAQSDHWFRLGADAAAVRRGLAICAIRLHTAYYLAGDLEAASEALRIARQFDPGNRQVIKRHIAHHLPRRFVVPRLGRGVDQRGIEEAYRSLPETPYML